MTEAVVIFLLVLGVHSLRLRYRLNPFYALLGGITAIMSWVTDTGIQVEAFGISFLVGSTVFYTALILGVFVLYAFDGPRSARIAIVTIAGVSIVAPVIVAVLRLQLDLLGYVPAEFFPSPDLRINTASVLTTISDFIFLGIAWEFLDGNKHRVPIWARAFLTLLGVMWFDSLLFNTGAFLGTPGYVDILRGSLLNRLILSVFTFPFLYGYLTWQNKKVGIVLEHRPVLAFLKEMAEGNGDLDIVKREIARRQQTEEALRKLEVQYETLFREMMNGFAVHEVILDAAGKAVDYRFLAVNPAFEQMTGLKAKDIIGKRSIEVLPKIEPFWVEAYGKVALTGKAKSFENYSAELNKYFLVTAFQPAPNQLASVFTDITERKEVEKALNEVKMLSGLLPICASCKQIRNDTGYWQSVESYISSHSQAEFTHGLCPDCIKKLYPDIADDLLKP
ncbi:diguanylate cyclase/phosphodiesterase [Dehalogenimonas sp. WBC-2]|nr:diguanylate cyclase/phosphodiesterase [Dehalogenimonas sp. WBC-2]